MSVDTDIEDFAFALFDKLWTQIGFDEYKNIVPEYPDVRDFPLDDFCDGLKTLRDFTESYYFTHCEQQLDHFALSRSDFFAFLDDWAKFAIEYGIHELHAASLLLATMAMEMGMACLRRKNYLFILSCPLAFAMVFEDRLQRYFPAAGWREVLMVGDRLFFAHQVGSCIETSAMLRRNLIYRFQLLRVQLLNKCPDSLIRALTGAIVCGGRLELPALPNVADVKRRAAMYLPFYVQFLFERYLEYMAPIYEENFINRHKSLGKSLILDIAEMIGMEEKFIGLFAAVFELSVFGDETGNPLFSESTPDSPSVEVAASSQEIKEDNLDIAHECEDQHPKDISEALSLLDLHDLKTKDGISPDPRDDPDLHALNGKDSQVPKPPSIVERSKPNETSTSCPSISQQYRVASKLLQVCTALSKTKDFEDGRIDVRIPFEPHKRVDEIKSKENADYTYIPMKVPNYFKPPPYQSNDDADQNVGSPRGDGKYTGKYDGNTRSKIPDYVKPPPYEVAIKDQPIYYSGAKKLGENTENGEGFSVNLADKEEIDENNLKGEGVFMEANSPLQSIAEKFKTDTKDESAQIPSNTEPFKNYEDSRYIEKFDSDPTQKKEDANRPQQQQSLTKDKHLMSPETEHDLGAIPEDEVNFEKGSRKRKNKKPKKTIIGSKNPKAKKNGPENVLKRTQKASSHYDKPPAYQSEEAFQYAYGVGRADRYDEKSFQNTRIPEYAEPPPYDLDEIDPSMISFGRRKDDFEEENLMDREAKDEICVKREDDFKGKIASGDYPLQNKDVCSENHPDEASSIETQSETKSSVASVQVSEESGTPCSNNEQVSQLESKTQRESTREAESQLLDTWTIEANLKKLKKRSTQWKLSRDLIKLAAVIFNSDDSDDDEIGCSNDQSVRNSRNVKPLKGSESESREKTDSCPIHKMGDIHCPEPQRSIPNDAHLIQSSPTDETMSGAIAEDEDKSGKRENVEKDIKDCDEETEGTTAEDNDPEKSETIEFDVHQRILIMGVTLHKYYERRFQKFMDRISTKGF